MLFHDVCLEAISYFLPDQVLTSESVEGRMQGFYRRCGLDFGYLEKLTGVKERRIWPIGSRPSTYAAEAGRLALEKWGQDKRKIDLVLHGGVCRDAVEPATAARVHHSLRLGRHCQVMDVSNACLGFLNGIFIAAGLIHAGMIQNALIVSSENSHPIYEDTILKLNGSSDPKDYWDSLASLTLGSGAVAMVLSKKSGFGEKPRLIGGVCQAYTEGHELCEGNGDPYHQSMKTDARGLMAMGLEISKVTFELFKKELKWKSDTPKHVMHHQVSRSHQTKVFDALGLSDLRGYSDISWLGNTGSVAVPLSLAMHQDKVAPNDQIALLGIGSGVNCMMLGIEWH